MRSSGRAQLCNKTRNTFCFFAVSRVWLLPLHRWNPSALPSLTAPCLMRILKYKRWHSTGICSARKPKHKTKRKKPNETPPVPFLASSSFTSCNRGARSSAASPTPTRFTSMNYNTVSKTAGISCKGSSITFSAESRLYPRTTTGAAQTPDRVASTPLIALQFPQ